MRLELFFAAAAFAVGCSALGVAFLIYRFVVVLEDRVSRVTQHLAEESAEHGANIDGQVSAFNALKQDAQNLIAKSENLIILANARVTDARGVYGDAQMMRDNALRRIEKWDAAMVPMVDAIDKFKDRSERKMAAIRKDLDAVISAQAASSGALTKRVKVLDERLSGYQLDTLGKLPDMDLKK